jgi:hypothetical protein
MLYRPLLLFVLLSAVAMAHSRDDRANTSTEIRGIDAKHITKASNGNLYIRNAKIYTKGGGEPIEINAGSDVRGVVISNLKVNARNLSLQSNASSSAVMAISSQKGTPIELKNVDIYADRSKLVATSRLPSNSLCAGVLCIESQNNAITLDRVKVASSSIDAEVASKVKATLKCAGALCVQSQGAQVQLKGVDISNRGNTLYKIAP